MCGIIGCTGVRHAVDTLVDGLRMLEYRGYDSAGVAWFDREGVLKTEKSVGKIRDLEARLALRGDLDGKAGIGHTRWATHGAPTDANSHPHGTARVQLVHNGIIENYAALKGELLALGYAFASDTDTEAAALLLDRLCEQTDSHAEAMRALAGRLVGSFAIGAVFADEPEVIYAIRRESPLLIAVGEGTSYLASDMTAVLAYTRRYLTLMAGELAILTPCSVTLLGENGEKIEREPCEASWDVRAAERGGHPHFMHKEIFEEPRAIRDTLAPRISQGLPDFSGELPDAARLACAERIYIVACGTAYHAGLLGGNAIERYARIPVTVEVASEFRYRDPILSGREPVIFISQSGETADTLAALRLARSRGAYTVGLVNVVGSSVAREADAALYTYAGPEISVASTKAYTVQTALLSLFALHLAVLRGCISHSDARRETAALLSELPEEIERILAREGEIASLAEELAPQEKLFFIGRRADYCAATEASLKLKEISYIHSEAYAAGELKHGTISLIEQGTPVIALSTEQALREKMLGNVREVTARGARVLLFAVGEPAALAEAATGAFLLPEMSRISAPIALATALQLLAYHTACLRGCDVDQPRNLAKSVTVE